MVGQPFVVCFLEPQQVSFIVQHFDGIQLRVGSRNVESQTLRFSGFSNIKLKAGGHIPDALQELLLPCPLINIGCHVSGGNSFSLRQGGFQVSQVFLLHTDTVADHQQLFTGDTDLFFQCAARRDHPDTRIDFVNNLGGFSGDPCRSTLNERCVCFVRDDGRTQGVVDFVGFGVNLFPFGNRFHCL